MTDSILTVGNTTDISIKGRHFNGTRGLWELLTYKNVTRGVVTAENWNDIRLSYSWQTLICRDTNTGVLCRHLADPSSGMLFQSCFPDEGPRGADTGRGHRMAGKLYVDTKHPSGFSNLKCLHSAARGRTVGKLREWLEAQDAYVTSPRSKVISAQSLHSEYHERLGMRFSWRAEAQ